MTSTDLHEDIEIVVFVEGESDRQAVLAAGRKLGQPLEASAIVAIGGATNIGAAARALGRQAPLALQLGLCDIAEQAHFRTVLEPEDIVVCDRDLEDELIRALGAPAMLDLVDQQGEARTFAKMQQQPAQRNRAVEDQLRRFCGTRSGRKVRYAAAMVDALPPDRIPAPLRDLVLDRLV